MIKSIKYHLYSINLLIINLYYINEDKVIVKHLLLIPQAFFTKLRVNHHLL